MSLERTLDLARKLKELAERGEGGEKVNARKQLDKLLKKHTLTIEDLEIETPSYYDFKVAEADMQLFSQVVSSVIGAKFEIRKYSNRKNWYTVFCTNANVIEIDAKLSFYTALYQRELKSFMMAFVIKQELYPKDAVPKDLTLEERKELLKAYELSKGITKESFLKSIDK